MPALKWTGHCPSSVIWCYTGTQGTFIAAMETVVALLLMLSTGILASSPNDAEADGLGAESSRQKIYKIVHSHENRKYGDHGGHEYEEGDFSQKLGSRKRYGYLPVNAEIKTPVYYEGHPPSSKDNTYRENVAAYAPPPLANTPHQVIASPVGHSHYAIVDPITKNHQYFTLQRPKPHYERPLQVHPKSSYILEEEPHYAIPERKLVAKPSPQVLHYPHPVKDYSLHNDHHLLDKSHHTSGHGYYGDNSVHGESGHKAQKKYEVSGHKAHSSSGGHHDEHDHHHNRAHYERDRGYHYEKAYAYDRVRAHHDIGSNRGAHSDYKTQQAEEGHKDAGSHGHSSFHQHKNALYKGGHHAGGQGYQDYEYLSPHHHAHGK